MAGNCWQFSQALFTTVDHIRRRKGLGSRLVLNLTETMRSQSFRSTSGSTRLRYDAEEKGERSFSSGFGRPPLPSWKPRAPLRRASPFMYRRIRWSRPCNGVLHGCACLATTLPTARRSCEGLLSRTGRTLCRMLMPRTTAALGHMEDVCLLCFVRAVVVRVSHSIVTLVYFTRLCIQLGICIATMGSCPLTCLKFTPALVGISEL